MQYFINLDERGEFYADVRDPDGNTVLEIHGFDVFEDGFMKNKRDLEGLEDLLHMPIADRVRRFGLSNPSKILFKGKLK